MSGFGSEFDGYFEKVKYLCVERVLQDLRKFSTNITRYPGIVFYKSKIIVAAITGEYSISDRGLLQVFSLIVRKTNGYAYFLGVDIFAGRC